mgnify:CR=1 FL=1
MRKKDLKNSSKKSRKSIKVKIKLLHTVKSGFLGKIVEVDNYEEE